MSISTRELVGSLKELTDAGKEVSLTIYGSSMWPYLQHEKDMIYFKKPETDPKRGDMVFFRRDDGAYVMHRVIHVKKDGYYMVGDAQKEIEGPIRRDQIFGIVTKVRRNGNWEGPESFWWKFFAGPWLLVVPFRRGIISLYQFFRFGPKSKRQGKN